MIVFVNDVFRLACAMKNGPVDVPFATREKKKHPPASLDGITNFHQNNKIAIDDIIKSNSFRCEYHRGHGMRMEFALVSL